LTDVKLKMKREVKTMELGKKKTTAIMTFILILSMTAMMAVVPAGAQLSSGEHMPTFLKISVSPSPVGVTQPLYINAFITKPTVTATIGTVSDNYEGMFVRMTKPDGTTYDFPAKESDATGGIWYTHNPDQTGEYTFKAFYPGQHVSGRVSSMFGGATTYDFYYDPAESVEVTVTVQEDPIEWIYRTPGPPEEYWTRPIYATNWDWDVYGGHWFGLGVPAFANTGGYDAMGNFQPYSEGPETAHIMWSKSTHIGGQPGGHIEGTQENNYMATTIADYYFEPVILNGILYYTKFAGPNSNIIGWEALDIRTGEVLWSRSAGETGSEAIRMGSITQFHSMQEYGAHAHIWSAEGGGFFGGVSTLRIYDAWTGDYIATVENPQSPSYIVQEGGNTPGALLGYYTSGGNLVLWNSSTMLAAGGWTYGPSTTLDWASGIQWTAPIPNQIDGNTVSLSVAAVTRDVILVRSAPTPGMFVYASLGWQVTAGLDATTGETLWEPINHTLPLYEDISIVAAGDGVYVLHNKDTNEAYGYSLTDGSFKWGPVELKGNSWSALQRAGDIAYGLCFVWDSGGWVNAINLETGEIQWSFNRGSAGYDTPYGIYLLWYNNAIADGKLYLSEGAMYNPPLHPARTICLNATTDNPDGELIWSVLSYTGRNCPAIADGHMIVWNSFDMKIYSFGKGPTSTTATVQDDMIPVDGTTLIKGSVMDVSAGSKQAGVIERFPNGLPAVSDEDMRVWMEYAYMQQRHPRDLLGRDAKGVTVHITAMDPNNNTRDFGTATTDAWGNYVFEFEPEVPGMYQLIVTFEGSNAYWRSSTTTYVKVGPAAEKAPTADEIASTTVGKLPAYPAASDIAQETINKLPAYLTIDLIVLIIAVVVLVIGLLAYMALRKQK
jgi:hypothetical protein